MADHMTAQQQLAELNAAIVEHCGIGTDPLNVIKASRMAFVLILDHGPAIAELIAEVAEQKAWFDRIVEHRQAGGDVPHAMLGLSAQSRKRMHEIIEKLTTEPPSAN